jgi:hypothetical protein
METRYTQRTIVREGFTEQDTWRKALGDSAPLLAFASYGPLDAPDVMPAGGMCSGSLSVNMIPAFRED